MKISSIILTSCIFALLNMTACSTIQGEAEPLVFSGKVQKKHSKVNIPKAKVVLMKGPSKLSSKLLWPKVPEKLDESVTDQNGEFILKTTDISHVERMYLCVMGERKKIKIDKNSTRVLGDSVCVDNLKTEKENIILEVPEDFEPLRND